MRARLRRAAMAVMVTAVVVTEIGQGLAQPDPASVVRIELSEYAFSPSQVTLKAGRAVRLKVVNTGRATHMFASAYLGSQDLEIEEADIEVDAPKGIKYVKLQPGKSAEIKFTPAQKGTFDFSCDVRTGGRTHRDRGMKGQLVVN